MPPARFTDGFAAPILWGVSQLYSIVEIAQGLGLDVATVCAVIESRSPVRFPPAMLLLGDARQLERTSVRRRPRPVWVDQRRLDEPAYAAWARASVGATRTVEAVGA